MSDLNYQNDDARTIVLAKKPLIHRQESSCDYILPDYMGDVKKLLRYSVTPSPCEKFISGGDLTALSTLKFSVLYLDSEDVVREASFTSELECTDKLCDNTHDAYVKVEAEQISIRLWGPRKISAKAQLKATVYYTVSCVLPTVVLPIGAETLSDEISLCSEYYKECAEREFAEQIGKLSDVGCEQVELISSFAEGVVTSSEICDIGVSVSGYFNTAVQMKVSDEIVYIEKRIPFDEKISLDMFASDGAYGFAECNITDVCANINNESEDAGAAEFYTSVVISFIAAFNVRYGCKTKHSLITEAFVPQMRSSCEMERIEYTERCGYVSERRAVSHETTIGDEPLRQIISCDAMLCNPRWTHEGSVAEFSCDVIFRPLMCGNEPTSLYTEKAQTSITEKIKLPEMSEDCYLRTSQSISDVSCSFDGKAVYYSLNLKLDAEIMREGYRDCVSSINAEVEDLKEPPRILIYYPSGEQTLWQIAKKYAVSQDSLREHNKAPEAVSQALAKDINNGAILVFKPLLEG